ncbi:MAG: hypothetical protein WA061_03020 [Microgenomates group bacterium]
MDKNYTPLDIPSLQKKPEEKKETSHKSFDFNAIFLGLIVITLLIMAALLFVLIQKKLQTLSYVPFSA